MYGEILRSCVRERQWCSYALGAAYALMRTAGSTAMRRSRLLKIRHRCVSCLEFRLDFPLGIARIQRKQFGSFSFIVLFIFFNDEELTRSNFSVIDSRRVNVNEYKMRKRASICSIIRSDKASLIIAIYVERRTRK